MAKYSDEDKKRWSAAAEKQKEKMQGMIQGLTDTWQENPETIAEMLEFGSRIYRYSMRNNMLIYAQNPNATYVQSFEAWKKMGASIKKGEKGCKVYVPVNATILKVDGHLVPLEQATKEQKLQYKAGEIESITKQHFSIGNVFDISQTTYPKENYPKLFHMGYQSALHAAVTAGLIEYARTELHCLVEIADLKSISLRGNYSPQNNRIRLNEMLEDTEKLSTMSHELGHALLHQTLPVEKTTAQVELEADALGIMLESHFGMPLEDSRKRHLAEHYHVYHKAYEKAPKGQKPDSFGQVINNVFATFKKEIPVINEYVGKHLKIEEQKLARKGLQIDSYLKKYPDRGLQEPEKADIYDQIKREINILDYAGMHGIELQRVGRYYTLKGHDSVRIDPEKNCFWRNSGIGQTTTGSVIDFANAFVHDDDLHESLKELTGLVSGAHEVSGNVSTAYQETRQVRKSLEENLPERSKNMHRVYAYLTQTRYIDQDIVQDFVNRKMLYQDVKGNCVFLSYDQNKNPVFANLRGTLSNKKFLGDIAGSDYRQGFYIDNNAEKLIVTESVIDAMSVMSILKGQGEDYKAYDYLPLSGAEKHQPILFRLAEREKKEVLLALDHDVAGVKGMAAVRDKLIDELSGFDYTKEQITFHVPRTKDWNQDLSDAMKKWQPLKEVPFLENGTLPEIHQYAIQSTLQYTDKDFQPSRGMERYRLVELTREGEILPVDVKSGVVFRSEMSVRKQILEGGLLSGLYEEISYQEMLKKSQQILQGAEAKTISTLLQEKGQGNLTIKGFSVDRNAIVAKVAMNESISEEPINQDKERLYIATGYAFDGTYQEYDLTDEQRQELEEYIQENHLDIREDVAILMTEVESIKEEPFSSERQNAFLDVLQAEQLKKNAELGDVLSPEVSLGIG